MILEPLDSHAMEDVFTVAKQHNNEPLADCVRAALDNYFDHLDGHSVNNLHQMVIEEVERPMLERVMNHTGGNQSKAAKLLGISRSTLRKKLEYYGVS